MGFDFIVIAPSNCLVAAFPLSLDMGYLYGGFQCSPVDGCSTASFNFGVLIGGDEHMFFYSAILNQSLSFFFNFILFLNFT